MLFRQSTGSSAIYTFDNRNSTGKYIYIIRGKFTNKYIRNTGRCFWASLHGELNWHEICLTSDTYCVSNSERVSSNFAMDVSSKIYWRGLNWILNNLVSSMD